MSTYGGCFWRWTRQSQTTAYKIPLKQMLLLTDSLFLANRENGHEVTFFCSRPKVKMRQNETKYFIFVFLLTRTTFNSRVVQLYPMYPISYATDISQNYITLSYLHFIHNTKYIQKVDKPMIYVLCNARKWTRYKRGDMIMHKYINS